jgi:hypothetical protein
VISSARELRGQRERSVITTPHGGYLYVKHLPRRVKHAVKKGILRRRLNRREYRAVDRYLMREGRRDQSHRFKKAKPSWGPGPWQEEPDRVDFVHAGLQCVILRNLHVSGTLNGYVGVPPSHPWWGKEEDECLATPQCEPSHISGVDGPFHRFFPPGHKWWSCDHRIQSMVEAHGGVNWASPTIQSTKQAHVDLWWFAFDTGHAGDFSPMMEATMREVYLHQDPSGEQWARHKAILRDFETYRELPYVRHELETLAEQIAMAAQVQQ